jgi:hypothetical protein
MSTNGEPLADPVFQVSVTVKLPLHASAPTTTTASFDGPLVPDPFDERTRT